MTTEVEDKAAQDKLAEEKRVADQKAADQKAEADKKVAQENKPSFFTPKADKGPDPAKPIAQDTREAGYQQIREGINLIKTHSGAAIGGSMLHDALDLLEAGYASLGGNEPRAADVRAAKEAEDAQKAEVKRDEPSKPFWPAKA
jgi:hypothetical protein